MVLVFGHQKENFLCLEWDSALKLMHLQFWATAVAEEKSLSVLTSSTHRAEAPCTPDARREAKQIRMRKSCCNNRTVHTTGNEQCMTQQATKWDLAPFLHMASRIASSVHGAWVIQMICSGSFTITSILQFLKPLVAHTWEFCFVSSAADPYFESRQPFDQKWGVRI